MTGSDGEVMFSSYNKSHINAIEENNLLNNKIKELEHKLLQLDRQVFYLKTLFDINQEISPLDNTGAIIKGFLMMIMGTFGVLEGFIVIFNKKIGKIDCFESRPQGIHPFKKVVCFFEDNDLGNFFWDKPFVFFDQGLDAYIDSMNASQKEAYKLLKAEGINAFISFKANEGYYGAIALGRRITGENFSLVDREVMLTLSNQIAITFANWKSFEIINQLNKDLQRKNRALEETLSKIELLENAKALLCKFVPKSLEKIINSCPDLTGLDKKNKDISILFLDIEGYTALSEKLEYEQVTHLIETYFSCFLDDIHYYEGDINMTSGDGLMILFQNEDKNTHALNAVRTALAIKEKTCFVNKKVSNYSLPVSVNIGINSGRAFIGTARFESYYGSRWTYTALGPTVNLASRIGAFAKKGQILISKETAQRVNKKFLLKNLGPQHLKNIKQAIHLYKVIGTNISPL